MKLESYHDKEAKVWSTMSPAGEGGGPHHHLEVSTFVDDEGIVAAELQYRLPEPEEVERNVTCEMCDNFASIIG